MKFYEIQSFLFFDIVQPTDTSKWPIDYSDPRPRYLRYILSAAYATGAINMDETIFGDALIIGLGGGSANNYLRHATKNVILSACYMLSE